MVKLLFINKVDSAKIKDLEQKLKERDETILSLKHEIQSLKYELERCKKDNTQSKKGSIRKQPPINLKFKPSNQVKQVNNFVLEKPSNQSCIVCSSCPKILIKFAWPNSIDKNESPQIYGFISWNGNDQIAWVETRCFGGVSKNLEAFDYCAECQQMNRDGTTDQSKPIHRKVVIFFWLFFLLKFYLSNFLSFL